MADTAVAGLCRKCLLLRVVGDLAPLVNSHDTGVSDDPSASPLPIGDFGDYELLAGRPPFQADTPLATMRQVMDSPPKRPSSTNQRVDRDLETI